MDAALITAWATVGLIGATLLVGGATCLLIWRGIKAMDRSSIERAQDRREAREADLRRHKETMDEGLRRHKEAMDEGLRRHKEATDEGRRRHKEAMDEGLRRHKEATDEGQRRHEETMAQHDATLEALRALIERTAPPAMTRGQGAD